MTAGDWVSLGAAIVALLAMVVAAWQAAEAGKARKAAESQALSAQRSAEAAEVANELTLHQMAKDQADKATLELAQARLVRTTSHATSYTNLGINVTNISSAVVTDLRLDRVDCLDRPSWQWKLNKNGQNGNPHEFLRVRKDIWFDVCFRRGDRYMRLQAGQRYSITISFTDAAGIRWTRTDNSEPERFDAQP